MWMDHKFTADHERLLRDQVITDDQPGTVLRDFAMLLDFLGPQGVEAGGTYNLIALKYIHELDRRLSRPLNLELQRPQLRSHPYLHGLNLLLRASGLTRVEGAKTKARLVVDPAMLEQWNRLNPTERYFNLLEAWLRLGRSEMVGERGRDEELLPPCLQAWRESWRGEGRQFDAKKPADIYIHVISRDFYLLGLMELFGLIKVKQPPTGTTPWVPAALERVPFGDAFFSLYITRVDPFGRDRFVEEADEDEEFHQDLELEEDEQLEDRALDVPRFGAWQPLFAPYFPEWRSNLQIPRLEVREGTFVFRVSLGKVWRLIAISAELTLDDLVDWILRSMRFDNDHLYKFSYRNRLGGEVSIGHPVLEGNLSTDVTQIGSLPLEVGQTMDLLYDFGDCWTFTVKLERIEPPGRKIKSPRILERHGKAPAQYAWED